MKFFNISIGASALNAAKLPGYMRRAWILDGVYGGASYYLCNGCSVDVAVGQEMRPSFAVVLHQNTAHSSDVKLEILVKPSDGESTYLYHPFDPQWLLNVIKTDPDENFHVEIIDARAFITGMFRKDDSTHPSESLCSHSNGMRFLYRNMDALATLYVWKDRMRTIPEAMEVNSRLNDIAAFKKTMAEMEKSDNELDSLKDKLADMMHDLVQIDNDCSECHRKYENCIEFLKKFGIDYSNKE